MHPVWWGSLINECENKGIKNFPNRFLDSVAAFSHSHLIQSATNELLLIGINQENCEIIFSGNCDSNFDKNAAKICLRNLVKNGSKEISTLSGESLITPALTKSLCFAQRLKRANPHQQWDCRCLVLKVSSDASAQHMGLMNIFFTAEKHRFIIDAAVLGKMNIFHDLFVCFNFLSKF